MQSIDETLSRASDGMTLSDSELDSNGAGTQLDDAQSYIHERNPSSMMIPFAQSLLRERYKLPKRSSSPLTAATQQSDPIQRTSTSTTTSDASATPSLGIYELRIQTEATRRHPSRIVPAKLSTFVDNGSSPNQQTSFLDGEDDNGCVDGFVVYGHIINHNLTERGKGKGTRSVAGGPNRGGGPSDEEGTGVDSGTRFFAEWSTAPISGTAKLVSPSETLHHASTKRTQDTGGHHHASRLIPTEGSAHIRLVSEDLSDRASLQFVNQATPAWLYVKNLEASLNGHEEGEDEEIQSALGVRDGLRKYSHYHCYRLSASDPKAKKTSTSTPAASWTATDTSERQLNAAHDSSSSKPRYHFKSTKEDPVVLKNVRGTLQTVVGGAQGVLIDEEIFLAHAQSATNGMYMSGNEESGKSVFLENTKFDISLSENDMVSDNTAAPGFFVNI